MGSSKACGGGREVTGQSVVSVATVSTASGWRLGVWSAAVPISPIDDSCGASLAFEQLAFEQRTLQAVVMCHSEAKRGALS